MRKAEIHRIQDAICPMVAERLEPPDEPFHCSAAIELQHEVDVLDNYCRDVRSLNKLEHLIHDTGLPAGDSALVTCHTQILTRKSSRYDRSAVRNLTDVDDVGS